MLSVFRHLEELRRPAEHDISNFCTLVDEELHENPDISANVTEIVHYKDAVSICRLDMFGGWNRDIRE